MQNQAFYRTGIFGNFFSGGGEFEFTFAKNRTIVSSFVWTQFWNVTEGGTDGQNPSFPLASTALCIASNADVLWKRHKLLTENRNPGSHAYSLVTCEIATQRQSVSQSVSVVDCGVSVTVKVFAVCGLCLISLHSWFVLRCPYKFSVAFTTYF